SKPAVLETLQRLLIEFNAGSLLTQARNYAFRTPDVMLTSTLHHQHGQIAAQKQVSIAAIGQNATVFTTKPLGDPEFWSNLGRGLANWAGDTPEAWATSMSFPWAARPYDGLVDVVMPFGAGAVAGVFGHDGPGPWIGTVTLPSVWQVENVAIAFYKPTDLEKTLSKDLTHAWFPKHAFDEVRWHPFGNG